MFIEALILLILLILSGFFSGIEIALFSITSIKVKSLLRQGVKGSKTLTKIKKDPRKLLITILVGNNLVNIGAASFATLLATQTFGNAGVGIATGVMTFLILIFGEITPKAFATQNAEKVSLLVAKPIDLLTKLLYPIIIILEYITRFVTKLGGKEKKPLVTEEELKTLVEVGAAEKEIEVSEKEMIKKVLQFNDITAEDVMTPRVEMFCIDSTMKLKDVIPLITSCQFSRIPLYKKTKDNIVGIIHIRDILTRLGKNKLNITLKNISKKPFFIPEHKIINELFKEFQKKQRHMAIVVDEYGGTAGLVTLEDLLEELVGEIVDESDINKQVIMRVNKNTIKVHGNTEIDDINDFFNIKLPGKGTDTISAFILKRLKKIPRKGEKLRVGNIELAVREATKKRVIRVKITKKLPKPVLTQKKVVRKL